MRGTILKGLGGGLKRNGGVQGLAEDYSFGKGMELILGKLEVLMRQHTEPDQGGSLAVTEPPTRQSRVPRKSSEKEGVNRGRETVCTASPTDRDASFQWQHP